MRWLFVILFAIPVLAVAQEVRLSAKPNQDRYLIGEWIDVRVEGVSEAAIDTIGPALRDSLGAFEVLRASREGTGLGWNFRFTTLDSGTVVLPPIPFAYRLKGDTTARRAYTNSLSFAIAGVAFNPQGDIKDIKPPVSAPWTFEDLWPYGLGAILLAGLIVAGYYYYRWRKQKREAIVDVRPAIPPHHEALAALRALEERRLWQQGQVKQFYSEATEIIRRFFERRWNIIALELTSVEILIQLRRFPEAEGVWKELNLFFETADLVKFAKYQPSPEECTDEIRMAYDIVRAMVPVEAPEPSAVAQEAADVR